ncbi:hypothetical protein NQ315_001607 [Exocentrus adspersus]|uniref:Uncharacterized protein n=1 Tax=Exocentrus adspersus TaxID=1586481 RepID=A0AAV8W9Q4_9CUCU|nr:hypothetical protein NQ315_001607 [Exocentrus adspersus]
MTKEQPGLEMKTVMNGRSVAETKEEKTNATAVAVLKIKLMTRSCHLCIVRMQLKYYQKGYNIFLRTFTSKTREADGKTPWKKNLLQGKNLHCSKQACEPFLMASLEAGNRLWAQLKICFAAQLALPGIEIPKYRCCNRYRDRRPCSTTTPVVPGENESRTFTVFRAATGRPPNYAINCY